MSSQTLHRQALQSLEAGRMHKWRRNRWGDSFR